MRVAITGTPGTGKSSISDHLEGFQVIDLKEFAQENNIGEKKEELEIDVNELREAFEETIEHDKDLVLEGHFSHFLSADLCVVLRCDPKELENRLRKRAYSDEKINENVEAEKIDLSLQEALETQDNVLEFDTTGKTPEESAEELKEKIENRETGYGEVDWSDSI